MATITADARSLGGRATRQHHPGKNDSKPPTSSSSKDSHAPRRRPLPHLLRWRHGGTPLARWAAST